MVAIISDTHMPKGDRRLPDACVAHLREAELILHAGDIATATTLAELELIGPPVLAVCGNVDDAELRARLPLRRTVQHAGRSIAIVHDSGPKEGRLHRLREWFPDADAVVFGHSHLPCHESEGDFQIFNPGSPTERRRAPTHTMGVAEIDADGLRLTLVEL